MSACTGIIERVFDLAVDGACHRSLVGDGQQHIRTYESSREGG
jgi:hypothetical protein